MTNLYKYELSLETGEIKRTIIEDVIIFENEYIVRSKHKDYDLHYGGCTHVFMLNKYYEFKAHSKYDPKVAIDIITYASLNDDIDIEKIKDMAIKIIALEVAEKQELINKIIKSEVRKIKNWH
jgi:hypothetical protein